MYSMVSVIIEISWYVQYSLSTVSVSISIYCSTVSTAFLLFLILFYCFRMQQLARGVAPQSLSQVHALAFRRYMYDHQVEEAEWPLCGANDQCTSCTQPRTVAHTRQIGSEIPPPPK